jgi:hypothetical protein
MIILIGVLAEEAPVRAAVEAAKCAARQLAPGKQA